MVLLGEWRVVLQNRGDTETPNWTFNASDRYSEPINYGDVVYVYVDRIWKSGQTDRLFEIKKGSGRSEEKRKDSKNTMRLVGDQMGDEYDGDFVEFTTPDGEFGDSSQLSEFERVIASAISEENQQASASSSNSLDVFAHFI